MYNLNTGNPYNLGDSSSFDFSSNFLSTSLTYHQKTYNCKSVVYPDNSVNYCLSHFPLWNQDLSFKRSQSFKQLCLDLNKLHYQHLKVLDVIQTSFDGCVNNFLLSKRSERLSNIPFLDSSERDFLRSLRNSLRTDNFKKTKERLFDYVKSNTWTWFFTGTFDEKRYNSHNADELKKVLQDWFKNMVRNYQISYIVIFEKHKKGGIHIHGLIKENSLFPLRLVESGTRSYYGFKKPMRDNIALKHGLDIDNGHIVYNLKTWKFGWSTAIRCYNKPDYIARYVTKYISKGNSKIMGRYFWHSQDLDKPKTFYFNVNYDDFKLPKFHGFKYYYQCGDSPEVQQILKDMQFSSSSNLEDYEEIYTDATMKDKIREIKEDNFYSDWVDLSASASPSDQDFMEGWIDL